MAMNTIPTYGLAARHGYDGTWTAGTSPLGRALSAAANDFTGTNANNLVVATADETEGAYIKGLSFKALGTNVASAVRVFLNNGGDPTVAANNAFFDDMALPATTASAVGQTGPRQWLQMDIKLAPGERVLAGLATGVAAGWEVIPIMEKF
jgi:hypothetical protein